MVDGVSRAAVGENTMSDRVTIAWTPEMLASFKTVIEIAELEGASGFEFNGNRYDRRYAKYLAEYLEGVFKARGILKE